MKTLTVVSTIFLLSCGSVVVAEIEIIWVSVSFEIFDSIYTVKNDPYTEVYIVFKDIKKGTEFLVLYHDDVKKCQFGYCTQKGEVFSPKITIKECVDHFDSNYCFVNL